MNTQSPLTCPFAQPGRHNRHQSTKTVRMICVGCGFLLTIAVAGRGLTSEPGGAADAAKAIAPLIDEQTFFVVCIEAPRLSAGPIAAFLAEWVPAEKPQIDKESAAASAVLQAFLRAGGRQLYLVFSLADPPFRPRALQSPFAVAPLTDGADAKALGDLLQKLHFDAAERIGGTVVAGSRPVLDRLKAIEPVARPQVAAALGAAGDFPVRAAFVPPNYWQRVIEEVMPTLPPAAGGGPSNVLTRGVRWAGIGVGPPPELALRVVIQSADAPAAAALRDKWADLWRPLREMPIGGLAQRHEELVRLLTPEVQADRLIVELAPGKGMDALLSLLKATIKPKP